MRKILESFRRQEADFSVTVAAVAFGVAMLAGPAFAGPVFLTGHDPDFHAQGSIGAQKLLKTGLSFVTGGTYDDGAAFKFLWVEAFPADMPGGTVPGGHLYGVDGLTAIGLVNGTNFDHVNAAGFASANLLNYTAIGVASSFGGILSSAELNALIARSTDIKNFINAGGGLFAAAECSPATSFCLNDTLSPPNPAPGPLFGFLPVSVLSTSTIQGYSVTPYGASLGLTDADVNDPTHNSFAATGGLNIVDVDDVGVPTTLAGNVRITDDVFTPVPEPVSIALFAAGLLGLGAIRHHSGSSSGNPNRISPHKNTVSGLSLLYAN